MKALRALTLACVVFLVGLGIVSAQTLTKTTNQPTWTASIASTQSHALTGIVKSYPAHDLPVTGDRNKTAKMFPQLVANPIPLWTYNVTGYDGNPYSGTIIGLSPYNHGKTTTTIPTQLIPLVITITDSNGTVIYDPTAADPCVPGHTGIDIIANSPIFTDTSWTMNGVDAGTTQYEDADVRTEFWSLVGGTPYHLALQEATLSSQALSFGTGAKYPGSNFPVSETNACEEIGVVNVNNMITAVEALITGPLAGTVNIGTNPLFLTKNVVMADPGTNLFANCCILGFHDAIRVGPNLQLFSPFEVDTAQAFGPGFTDVIAHEVGEGIHDPDGSNPTPPWGNEGQTVGTCQDNFEVGDPLSIGFGTPSNEWVLTGANGLTYDLQELAFFNWFYGNPNLAESGHYSNHGTFTGYAIACPPGGTN
ncbi:MAG: hypothetical protein ABSD75_15065 [Terriglobales bacterium]|jgi:hypothetical protein